jgi:lysozyme
MDAILGADISHHNGVVDLDKAKASGLQFLFHKATQGTGYVDTRFYENQEKAVGAGLLFGAYHFGTGDDVPTQVKHFLATVGDLKILVLDFEKNTSGGPSMTLAQAEGFVDEVQTHTGRLPILYTGNWLKDMNKQSELLCSCPLWLAQYSSTPKLPLGFTKYSFLQYTDGTTGPTHVGDIGPLPHEIAGIGHCDVDLFNGTLAELQAFWGEQANGPIVTPGS